jgi:hypothetical protein
VDCAQGRGRAGSDGCGGRCEGRRSCPRAHDARKRSGERRDFLGDLHNGDTGQRGGRASRTAAARTPVRRLCGRQPCPRRHRAITRRRVPEPNRQMWPFLKRSTESRAGRRPQPAPTAGRPLRPEPYGRTPPSRRAASRRDRVDRGDDSPGDLPGLPGGPRPGTGDRTPNADPSARWKLACRDVKPTPAEGDTDP